MKNSFELPAKVRDELLREGACRHAPVALTCKSAEGWVKLQAHFNGIDVQTSQLVLQYTLRAVGAVPTITAGQSVNVSFRRGHRKAVFDTTVIEHKTRADHQSGGGGTLRLQWPAAMFELQRRLYHRTSVPRGVVIPVDIWLDEANAASDQAVKPVRGTMLDVSAGGVSLALPAHRLSAGGKNAALMCRFATAPDGQPVEITATTRSHERMPNGRIRLGLQFMNLDTSQEGQGTIRQIHRLTTRLQRSGGRR